MKLYTCTDHDCHWPVGVASIVIAEDEKQAIELLDIELKRHRLKGHNKEPYTFAEVKQSTPVAIVLLDGDY